MSDWTRRKMLGAAVATSGYCVLKPNVFAFAQSLVDILNAPKLALVIGNAKYASSPLKNAVNDAKGMDAVLKGFGFSVNSGIDLGRSAMNEEIARFTEGLAKNKAIGLFYFAGHGAQLEWRNYLIPVDANIGGAEELRDKAIDLNTVLDRLNKARNPMNMVILDACRDNPFGGSGSLAQKGLSQMDAPPGTFLAYATAPGNTAADGEGEHGLYTGNLLREIKVPEAKVEDIFKRVRLHVRKQSKGRQIPWESTSLEQDFWFLPPRETKKLAAEALEREFRDELALWEKIQHSTQPEPLEDYLRQYPRGRYTELAQLQLDRVLAKQGEQRIEIVSAPENPYSKGTVRIDTAYKVGDSYSYLVTDILTGLEVERETLMVSEIRESEVIFDGGVVTDLMGNYRETPRRITSPAQFVPVEFVVGKSWSTQFTTTFKRRNRTSVVKLDFRIVEREKLTVPAGTFYAFRVEGTGWGIDDDRPEHWEHVRWYAPDRVRHYVKSTFTTRVRTPSGNRTRISRNTELQSFKQS